MMIHWIVIFVFARRVRVFGAALVENTAEYDIAAKTYPGTAGRTLCEIRCGTQSCIHDGNLSATRDSSLAPRCAAEFRVSRTRYQVIVDHAGRLHQRIADRRAHKLESSPQQIAAHRIGFRRTRGHVRHTPPAILFWFASDKTPQVSVETPQLFPHREKRLRVLDRGRNLQSIPYDPSVAEQSFHIARAVMGDLLRAESIERFPIVLSLLQNSDPAQSRL